MSGGIVASGPVGTRIFQLLAVKSALNLEKIGLRHSRGSVRKAWALHYGLKPSAKCDVVIAKIEAELKTLSEDPRGTGIEVLR